VDGGVQARIGHQLFERREALNIPDFAQDGGSQGSADAWDSIQLLFLLSQEGGDDEWPRLDGDYPPHGDSSRRRRDHSSEVSIEDGPLLGQEFPPV